MKNANGWLYLIVFSIYCLVISLLAYQILLRWFPERLMASDVLTEDRFVEVFGFFCSIVLFSFIGASYTVYGRFGTQRSGYRKSATKSKRRARASQNKASRVAPKNWDRTAGPSKAKPHRKKKVSRTGRGPQMRP